jgi:upstream-binding transcription factor
MPRKIKKKDVDAPKRPWTGFMFFNDEKRKAVRQANPDMKKSEIAKELARLWRELTAEEKQPFLDKANEDKKRYREELLNYREQDKFSLLPQGGRKTKSPRNTSTAFTIFSKEKRLELQQQNPKMKPKEVSKELGRMWKEMSDDQRRPYTERAAMDDDNRYLEEVLSNHKEPKQAPLPFLSVESIQSIDPPMEEEGEDEMMEEPKSSKKKKKKKKKKKTRDPNTPRRPWSAFMIFANEKREEVRALNPDLKKNDVGKELGRIWKELPENHKQNFRNRAAEDKKRYLEEKKKDPNAPKPPLSSFMFFSIEHRVLMRQEDPSLTVTDISKKLGALWRSMPPDQKQKYVELAAKDKQRFQLEMQDFQATKNDETASFAETGFD